MKLIKLEIYGFKSFLDRTEILFDDGVTAIVGPNGCGKSNVADAIRWVLGEQSAKTLRGGVMQDIIFNGTESKKSLSYCEVSLYLDNSDKTLPLDYDEVCITRKLYRSGDSEYLLNKSTCRLKDVLELMRIAQIGREGYSIIGQGRVEQFINLKPDDRREIFDEATGIAGVKQKKNEAERKLVRTRDNLTRYLDILGELERQLEPMKSQAVTAKKYLECKEKLKYNEVNSFIYRSDFAESEKITLNKKIQSVSDEYAVKSQRSNELETEYQHNFKEIQTADEKINVLREKQLELVVERQKLASSNDLSNQRIDMLKDQSKVFQEEIQEANNNIKQFQEELEGMDGDLFEQNKYLAKIQSEMIEFEDSLTIANANIENKNFEIENSRANYSEFTKKFADLTSREISCSKSMEFIQKSIDETSSQTKNVDEKISGIFDKINELNTKVLHTESEYNTYKNASEVGMKNIAEIRAKLSQTTEELYDCEKRKAGLVSQRNFLLKMKESFDGFSAAVRKLLTDAKTDDRLSSKIEGVIANLITVPKNIEVAIEATLGNAIQNVVTNTMEDTKFLISHLKEKRHGIVTFLPLASIRPRRLHSENERCLTMEGVLGVASDLVSYDEKYENAILSLLGATVVVDNMDNAIAVARRFNSSFKIVTTDGSILAPGGSISGGSHRPQIANILSYDREIADSEIVIGKLNNKIRECNDSKITYSENLQELQAEKNNNVLKMQSFEVSLASLKQNLLSLKGNQSDEELETYARTEKLGSYKTELVNIKAELADIMFKKEQLRSITDIDETAIEKIMAESENLRGVAKEISEKFTSSKIEMVQISSEINSINGALNDLKDDIENSKISIEKKKENIKNNKIIIARCQEELIDVVDMPKGELTQIEEELGNFDNFKKELNSRLLEIDSLRTQSITEIQKLETKKNGLQMDLGRIDSDLEILKEKLADEYELDYDTALVYKDIEYKITGANGEIKKLKDAIYRLGHVNVNAIEELLILNDRYESMAKQRDDMTGAESDLKEVITELNTEMKLKFDEGFSKVSEYFTETFKELFGGGNARLKLVEHEGKDKLSYGVDIEAEPPGKSLQNINLLSGGEKALTAIAIIISIMKLRPMPFCIFDEIEAALDDVNTTRFAKYLSRFKDYTQFILVTHKKNTMEMANRIFGVTMQEKGVSKVVSVNFQDEHGKAIAGIK